MNKQIKIAIACLLWLSFSHVFAKGDLITDVRNYEWEQDRKRHSIAPGEVNDYPAVILENIQAYEYQYEDSNLILYSLLHRTIRVNNDDGIRSFNRIYVPMGNVIEISRIRARSISPAGEIINIEEGDIKELKDESDDSGYKIFAIEGLQPGSEVEYYYIAKEYAHYFGRAFYQYSIPSKNNYFTIISPSNLIFSARGYNQFPLCDEKTFNGKRILYAQTDYVPELNDEAFSFYNPNRMRVEFKLSKDTTKGSLNLLTWTDAAHHIHASVFQVDKKEGKSVRKWVKKLDLNKEDKESRIRLIENHIKTNFIIQEGYGEELYDLSAILTNHYGNKSGMVKLFAAAFKEAGIDFELVMTTDRSAVKFDKDFESWNYLVNYAFYFPSTEAYLSPDQFEYRYGMIPYFMTHNYGLFITPVQVGKFETALGEVRFIPATDYSKNFDNLDIAIEFSPDMDKTAIDISRQMGGYSGIYIQPYYSFLQEDKKREIAETLVKMSAEDAKFNELEILNGEKNLSPLSSPFTISADIESSSLIERAGNKYLFKLGKIIGPQMELYQEKERQNDVENDFNRSYRREIVLKIPDNYLIKNLEDIRMDIYFERNEERIFSFKSDYKVEGNKVLVLVEEFYKDIHCSKKHFEAFRKVINAAADFNKITLALESK